MNFVKTNFKTFHALFYSSHVKHMRDKKNLDERIIFSNKANKENTSILTLSKLHFERQVA